MKCPFPACTTSQKPLGALPPSSGDPTPAFLQEALPPAAWETDSGKVIFLTRHSGVFKGGSYGGKGSPSGWHSDSSWSRRGRPLAGNHKSPTGRAAGTLRFAVAGWRPEVLYLLTKMGKGRGESLRQRPPVLPLQPCFSAVGGEGLGLKVGLAVRCFPVWPFSFWNN